MKKQLAALGIILFSVTPAAKADETGLASIHDMGQESGRRICMTDHFHDGTGTGATRRAAEAAAKQDWMSFTAFEYGSDWGSYALASAKRMECSSASNGWSCSTSARPCRRYVKSYGESSKEAKR